MAMVINSNIQSLNAQRHLNNSLDAQNTATERLSSGLRINSAKDDAAGLAIANRMTSQVQGLNQAVRNANDGAALIQTAEGGLEETTNILQRMRELSIQSANGTYDTGNRQTLNAEVDQLKQEIDRISETTSFNGLNILDGKLGDIDLQVGENANQTISLGLESSSTKTLGAGSSPDIVGAQIATGAALYDGLNAIDGTGSAVGSAGMTVNGVSVGDLTTVEVTTLQEALDKVNTNIGVVATASAYIESQATTEGDGVIAAADHVQFIVTGADTKTQTFQISGTTSLESLVDKINEVGGESLGASLDDGKLVLSSQGNASVAVTTTGTPTLDDVLGADVHTANNLQARLAFTAESGVENVLVAYGDAGTALTTGIDQRREVGQLTGSIDAVGTAGVAAGEIIINGFEIPEYDEAIDYDNNTTAAQVDDVVAFLNQYSSDTGVVASNVTLNGGQEMQLQSKEGASISIAYKQDPALAAAKALTGLEATNDVVAAGGSVASIDISTAAGAQKSISVLDDAISQISTQRGELGAVANRLDYTTRNLSNISENAASARSSIMDADFAAESANLSRAQVLQQAGNAMLAQANSRPQQVLSLLQ